MSGFPFQLTSSTAAVDMSGFVFLIFWLASWAAVIDDADYPIKNIGILLRGEVRWHLTFFGAK